MQERQHDSKIRILDAALKVIREKGYSATRIDDVCDAAGLTKGSFFHHFKGKEDLAVQAADYWSEITGAFFRAAPYRQLDDPLDRVFGYIDFRGRIIDGRIADFTCLVGTMVQEVYDLNPTIRDACDRSIRAHAAEVAADIAAARDLHVPGADWSADSLALFTQAVLQGAFVLTKAEQDPAVATDMIGHLRRYVELLFGRDAGQA